MALTILHLTKRFGDLLVLEDISFEVKDSEFVCLTGRTGCGKTTLLRIVAGLENPTKGNILLEGNQLEGNDKATLIFQESALFSWRTVQKNVEFGLEIKGIHETKRNEIARKYIDLVQLTGFENYYPKQLSGGMKQRLAIARALAVNPRMLLMDEPFSSLDEQTRHSMQNEVLKIHEEEQKAILFVTHNISEAVYLADRIVVLTPRPASVKEIVEVNIERPRDMMDKRAMKTIHSIRQMIYDESESFYPFRP